MNNQWCAAGGSCPSGFTSPDADFLEFSTNQIAPFNGTAGTNAQKRMFGKSGWETLVQNTANDPKSTGIPTRTRYSSLAAVAPPSGADYTVNDSEASCRDSLDIRWMQDNVYELVLDRSGSMRGTPITNAKIAANLLIDQLQEGNAAIGVASFASSPSQDFSIRDIPDPDSGVKAGAKSAVNSLNASGSTALFDALILGLNNVNNFANASSNPNRAKVVFALSDGADNSSSATASSVIAGYQADNVPIIAFGYGAGAPTGVLKSLASNTGGSFYSSPSTLAEIQKVFIAANAAISSSAIVSSASILASASTSVNSTVAVDSTVGELMFSLTFNGAPGELVFTLLDPTGADSGVVFSCQIATAGTTSCSGTLTVISSAPVGDYTLVINNSSTTTDKTIDSIITATPMIGGDIYDVVVDIAGGATINYPQQARLTATVSRSLSIAGLNVSAEVTGPGGAITTVSLVDDGANGDSLENDGTYSALIDYDTDGTYNVRVQVDNAMGTAAETTIGALISHTADGSIQPPPGLRDPITENFSRSATTQFTVAGTQLDDHADNAAVGVCTSVTDDNSDTQGRIDFAGDFDCFSVVPGDPGADLTFRVTELSFAMNPVLTVFDSLGKIVATFDLTNSSNANSGIIGKVASQDLDATGMNFSVNHVDASAAVGGYNVSVGPAIFSDLPPEQVLPLPSNGKIAGCVSETGAIVYGFETDTADATIKKLDIKGKKTKSKGKGKSKSKSKKNDRFKPVATLTAPDNTQRTFVDDKKKGDHIKEKKIPLVEAGRYRVAISSANGEAGCFKGKVDIKP